MNEVTENRRTKMTKRMLKDSLIELMKEKPVRNITIKEICERADVNRSTFYRHYETQFELYNDIFYDITGDLTDIISSSPQTEIMTPKLLTDMLQYALDNRDIILILLSDNGCLNIGEAFSELIQSIVRKRRGENAVMTELELYVTQFILAGMSSIVWLWLNTENRQSAKEVATVVYVLVMNGLQRAMSLSKIGNKPELRNHAQP